MEPNDTHNPPASGGMNLFDHLAELRKRLIAALVVLVLVTIVCWSFAPTLFDWICRPLNALSDKWMVQLQVLGPMEMFLTYLKLGLLCAVFVSAPWILLQIWLFVSPGLYTHEKRWTALFVVFGSVFFVGGGAFAYLAVIPLGFDYLAYLTPENINNAWSVQVYVSVVTRLLLAFGIVFEVPLAMWVLSAAGIATPKSMARFRKIWIVLSWVMAAILTPPDPISQVMMAFPLIAFFELGLVGARILHRKKAQPCGNT